jgi:hypothetical protein
MVGYDLLHIPVAKVGIQADHPDITKDKLDIFDPHREGMYIRFIGDHDPRLLNRQFSVFVDHWTQHHEIAVREAQDFFGTDANSAGAAVGQQACFPNREPFEAVAVHMDIAGLSVAVDDPKPRRDVGDIRRVYGAPMTSASISRCSRLKLFFSPKPSGMI